MSSCSPRNDENYAEIIKYIGQMRLKLLPMKKRNNTSKIEQGVHPRNSVVSQISSNENRPCWVDSEIIWWRLAVWLRGVDLAWPDMTGWRNGKLGSDSDS